MDYSYYTGVTAYLKQNLKTEARLRVLAAAIPALQAHVDMLQFIPQQFKQLMSEADFTELQEFGYLFAAEGLRCPVGTPDDYQHPSVTHTVYKSDALTRLHLPASGFDKFHVEYTMFDRLVPLLQQLFGNDLVCVKSRSIDESGYFSEAPERVIVSTEDQKTRAA